MPRSAVRRVVVDEHNLPIDALQGAVEPLDQDVDIVALVEGRHDDAQFRTTAAAGRGGVRLGNGARTGDRDHAYSLPEKTGPGSACQGHLASLLNRSRPARV